MIDAYMWGHINRMSPEAPVPIVNIDKRENRLGGAANVALNIQSLGATPLLFSAIGDDHYSDLFIELMHEQKLSCVGIKKISNRRTTVKTRIISDNKHVLRVDEEYTNNIEDINLLNSLEEMIQNQSYRYHHFFKITIKVCLPSRLFAQLLKLLKNKEMPLIVDPKKENF